MVEDKIQNPEEFLFRFSFGEMLWIKEVEMVDSVDELTSSRSVSCWKEFPEFRTAGRDNFISFEQDHSNFLHLKKMVSLEEPKEDRFLRGRQIGHMPYDCFRVTDAHDIVLD